MSDLISREAAPLPCPLCSADMGIEGEGWEHPPSDDCPLDSLFILPRHVTAWNRRTLPAAPAVRVKPLVWLTYGDAGSVAFSDVTGRQYAIFPSVGREGEFAMRGCEDRGFTYHLSQLRPLKQRPRSIMQPASSPRWKALKHERGSNHRWRHPDNGSRHGARHHHSAMGQARRSG